MNRLCLTSLTFAGELIWIDMDGGWAQSFLGYQSYSTLEREIADLQAKFRALKEHIKQLRKLYPI